MFACVAWRWCRGKQTTAPSTNTHTIQWWLAKLSCENFHLHYHLYLKLWGRTIYLREPHSCSSTFDTYKNKLGSTNICYHRSAPTSRGVREALYKNTYILIVGICLPDTIGTYFCTQVKLNLRFVGYLYTHSDQINWMYKACTNSWKLINQKSSEQAFLPHSQDPVGMLFLLSFNH